MALDENQDFGYCVFGMDADIAVFTIIKSLQVVVATNVFLPSKLKRTFFLGQPLASGGCYFRNA
jgi:hypothetical protein